MNKLDFVRKLYRGKNCYSDPLTPEEIELIHIRSTTENIISQMLEDKKIIFLTGNPGDGKTYIIKALDSVINKVKAYVEMDLSSIEDYSDIVENIKQCYENGSACIIAANEYPFIKLEKAMGEKYPEISEEIRDVKKNSIVYGVPSFECGRIVVVDLNDRNLLDREKKTILAVIDKLVGLLEDSKGINHVLDENMQALSNELVREQLLKIFEIIAICGEHFVMRDILGTIAYAVSACVDEEEYTHYYDILFSGSSDLNNYLKQFDPVYLSEPDIDEQLWNGEIEDGWVLNVPGKWPLEYNNTEEALTAFASIKRKFYFENIYSKKISELQPDEYVDCCKVFQQIDSRKSKIRDIIVQAINRIYLKSDDAKNQLRIWSTHSYDLSRESSAAVSSRYIPNSELLLECPRLSDWLEDMEYTPTHLILRHQSFDSPVLKLDVDMLKTLFMVRKGYPVGLLSDKYEQMISQFLDEIAGKNGATRSYDEGEIIIANRKEDYKKSLFIRNNKYSFMEGEDL